MLWVGALSVLLLPGDGPERPEHSRALKAILPQAREVGGSPGGALGRAAELAETERFIAVPAGTRLHPAFAEYAIDDDRLSADAVVSWPSRNAVNGLCYQHGAIQCHARAPLLAGEAAASRVIVPSARSFGTVHPNGSPFQAFRAGLREGARLGLIGGRPPRPPHLLRLLPPDSLRRLSIWASIGADAKNGLWCVYGARLGCSLVQIEGLDPQLLDRPEWSDGLWHGQVAPRFEGTEIVCPHTGYGWSPDALQAASAALGQTLRDRLGLPLAELDSTASRLFKTMLAGAVDPSPFDALGNLYRDGRGLPQDLERAIQNYRIGAALGSGNAMNNLARMYRDGIGVPRDLEQAARLLAQATGLGNRFAPYHLARMRRAGWGMARDPAAAAELFELAAMRGFGAAHLELARLHLAGEGVPRDLDEALVHLLLAGEAARDELAALREKVDDARLHAAERRARVWPDADPPPPCRA